MAAKIALITSAENRPPDYSYDNSYAATRYPGILQLDYDLLVLGEQLR